MNRTLLSLYFQSLSLFSCVKVCLLKSFFGFGKSSQWAIVILSFFSSVQGAELEEFYNNTRMMGMGGASVAVANDETALLSNPAGLGKLRNAYGTFIDPEIDVSSNFSSMYRGSAISNPVSLTQVAAALLVTPNTPYHFRWQLFPSFVVKNFGIGIFAKQNLNAIYSSTTSLMTTSYTDDMAFVLGYNLRLWDGRIKIGVNGRLISRIQVTKDLDPAGDLTLATQASEGAGLATDAGLILAAPWKFIPTLSIVARDLGSTKFTSGKNLRMSTATIPAAIAQDYDVGLAIFPIHGNVTRSTLSLEYQKALLATTAVNKNRHYHVGYELNYADVLFVRAGMNQSFWTAGLELASKYTQLQFVSYGEDVGVDGVPVEDRRYGIKFAFRF